MTARNSLRARPYPLSLSPMSQQNAQRPTASDIDYRLLVPFLSHVVLAQTLILVVRITTSYRVIELAEPLLWLGIMPPALPLFRFSPRSQLDDGSTAAMMPRPVGPEPH